MKTPVPFSGFAQDSENFRVQIVLSAPGTDGQVYVAAVERSTDEDLTHAVAEAWEGIHRLYRDVTGR